jgi:hypothetical protein
MTPIRIKNHITALSNEQLNARLSYLSYTFCVNADFSKKEATSKLIDSLEMNMMEGLLRVLEDESGYCPLQNKIYENVERVFGNQDAYNINRMMSSIRRTKLVPIDVENEKYLSWMRNRVNYGVKAIIRQLDTFEFEEEESIDFA